MSGVVDSAGKIKPLKVIPLRVDSIREDDVTKPDRIVRVINAIIGFNGDVQKRLQPDFLDFEDVLFTSANLVQLPHRFNTRVRWWVVDWTSTGTPLVDSVGNTLTVYSPMLVRDATTDANTLVLKSYVSGTGTIRVQPRGA